MFERHKFYALADQTKVASWHAAYPDICNPHRGGYKGNEAEYPRIYRAMQLDADAAIESTSWGIGQLMGFNWRLCGEKTLYGFLLAMHHNEDVQLMLMAQFIRAIGADDELRRKDFNAFRLLYNGKASPVSYATKLSAAFERAERQHGKGR